ncbi:hypothetical protein [Prosthecobacter vanneervenii]|uniref:Zn-dependent protease with chaperone function n=1 Tax=Prosthecobacter vanneervenii TaxID=48466 RepID=A0A7W8DKT1_9BACT|nr:hypothetical protein [Prosthecobacter vanneervenii]MBB5033543.1 Zn-dependent protease with chaperone function [Prosthecobacter vanneervenii]
MNSQDTLRAKSRDKVLILASVVVIPAMVLAPIVLGLHVLGALPLSSGLLYGLVLPLFCLFVVCLIKFSWEARIIMTVCTGGLFLVSLPVMKKLLPKTAAIGVPSMRSHKATSAADP